MTLLLRRLAAAALLARAAGGGPAELRDLTVFHIGPRNVSRDSIPTDMNSGNALGEMYWDLGWCD
jgi:hypothetical protein